MEPSLKNNATSLSIILLGTLCLFNCSFIVATFAGVRQIWLGFMFCFYGLFLIGALYHSLHAQRTHTHTHTHTHIEKLSAMPKSTTTAQEEQEQEQEQETNFNAKLKFNSALRLAEARNLIHTKIIAVCALLMSIFAFMSICGYFAIFSVRQPIAGKGVHVAGLFAALVFLVLSSWLTIVQVKRVKSVALYVNEEGEQGDSSGLQRLPEEGLPEGEGEGGGKGEEQIPTDTPRLVDETSAYSASGNLNVGGASTTGNNGKTSNNPSRCSGPNCMRCCSCLWIMLGILVFLLSLNVIGFAADLKNFAPDESHLVTIDEDTGQQIQILCVGDPNSPQPFVLFEHGLGGSHLDFARVQRLISADENGENEKDVYSCAYSRAGYAYSSVGEDPRTAKNAAVETVKLMQALGWDNSVDLVVAGHSMAGLFTRIYERHLNGPDPDPGSGSGSGIDGESFESGKLPNIVAFTYVDAVNPNGTDNCDENNSAPLVSFFGYFIPVFASGIPRFLGYVGGLPLGGSEAIALMPSDLKQEYRSIITGMNYVETRNQETRYFGISCGQTKSFAADFYDFPVSHIAAGEGIFSNFTYAEQLAELSTTDSNYILLEDAGHLDILFDAQNAEVIAEELMRQINDYRGV